MVRHQEAADRAEAFIQADPRTSCFYARRAVELAVNWMYKADAALRLPYRDNLGALLHEPTFKSTVGEAVFNKAVLITRIGNRAVHDNRAISETASTTAVRELFHVCYWLAHTYARGLSLHRVSPTTRPLAVTGGTCGNADRREAARAGGVTR